MIAAHKRHVNIIDECRLVQEDIFYKIFMTIEMISYNYYISLSIYLTAKSVRLNKKDDSLLTYLICRFSLQKVKFYSPTT